MNPFPQRDAAAAGLRILHGSLNNYFLAGDQLPPQLSQKPFHRLRHSSWSRYVSSRSIRAALDVYQVITQHSPDPP